MPSTLPFDAQVGHALGFVAVTPGAAWSRYAPAAGAGIAAAYTRLDGGDVLAANLNGLVQVQVVNLAAAGGDTIYATAKDPGAGAATLGIPVPPQTTVSLPLWGTGTGTDVWIYGAATTPQVVVTALLAEG